MNEHAELTIRLQGHLDLCQQLLTIIEKETNLLRSGEQAAVFDIYQSKKQLLPKLKESVAGLKEKRVNLQDVTVEKRNYPPEVSRLMQKNQDLIMKMIVLDRENEQLLLRRGLLGPRELPSAQVQKPHFVADLYKRQSLK
ncbi:MAG: hypothetical protein JWM04_2251 [Verrucomicrobiales bacterium]|nr:hypothetical protein [Verrucomicrobiales bacterium]